MPKDNMLTLFENEYPAGVFYHTDILNPRPTALSRRRAQRVNAPRQQPNEDLPGGVEECRLCNPEKLKNNPTLEFLLDRKVANFPNADPFLPYDQRVIMLWHDDREIRKKKFHIYKLEDIRREELYYGLKATIELGKRFIEEPLRTTDLPRMVVGLNLGRLAGQTIPHIHTQYGWEIVMIKEKVTENRLNLYYEELEEQQLILNKDDGDEKVRVIAPWTPKGQYQLDLHFNGKYEIHKLEEEDIRLFAHLADRVLKHYVSNLAIQNVNIVFKSSPLGRSIAPVIASIVPRVNMPAMYEIVGIDVVDKFPGDIAAEFRKINWREEINKGREYDPESSLKNILEESK